MNPVVENGIAFGICALRSGKLVNFTNVTMESGQA